MPMEAAPLTLPRLPTPHPSPLTDGGRARRGPPRVELRVDEAHLGEIQARYRRDTGEIQARHRRRASSYISAISPPCLTAQSKRLE